MPPVLETLSSLTAHDWRRSPMARALSRAYSPPPVCHVWEWAEGAADPQRKPPFMLVNEDAAEPGEYRSTKTPWTRRLQELYRAPFMHVWDFAARSWRAVKVTEVNVQKSSQSGYSEAALNCIRWRVTYRPGNVIYAIDSAEEAKKIARRLLRSFKFLDKSIFTGDPDDIKTLEFQLRGMELLFYGSFSTGKFANKQASLTVSDEVEEHGKFILRDLESRKKTSTGGLQINLSKPKLKNGPINRAFLQGNQEEYFVPCPHCGLMQPLTFFSEERDIPFSEDFDDILDEKTGRVLARLWRPLPLGERRKFRTGRFVYEHCKNLLGKWDKLRILTETYYECAGCKGAIEEGKRQWMTSRGAWLPMVVEDFTPGVVSQHISDLYSEDELSSWGNIVLHYLKARSEGMEALRDFYNHRLGKIWAEEANETTKADIVNNMGGRTVWFVDAPNTSGQIVRNIFYDQPSADRLAAGCRERGLEIEVLQSSCPAYRRGTVPFEPRVGIIGADVGGNYAKWMAIAVHKNLRDVAVVDWGEELDPEAILHILTHKTWPTPGGKPLRIGSAWIDAKFRTKDVYKACLASKGMMIPTKGLGGSSAQHVKLWSYNHVPGYHEKFKELHYNDQRSKDALYLDALKRMRSRCWFPSDVEEYEEDMNELLAEWQTQDRRGFWVWSDEPKGPNHYGDCLKDALNGLNFMTRAMKVG